MEQELIDEILKELKRRKKKITETKETLNDPSEGYIRQYKGQIHELNYVIELIEKTKLKYKKEG